MDLFENAYLKHQNAPLSERLRPKMWSDFIGQESEIGPIKHIIQKGLFHQSLILWGPPGCGKTTFARLISQKDSYFFIEMNASDVGTKILKQEGLSGRKRWLEDHQRTLLFIDEIHRLNRGQQDALLPFMEKGDLLVVGATTENPAYRLSSALLSRSKLIQFKSLTKKDLERIVSKAFNELGYKVNELLSDKAINKLLSLADGDARKLLNFIEQIIEVKKNIHFEDPSSFHLKWAWPLESENLIQCLGHIPYFHDQKGDFHYDTASALIKSIRGSDPDASLYYLARFIEGGEDPLFITRRLIILASEDIGNADPRALLVAVATHQAVEIVGLPEGAINLAHAVTYLATVPKSNSSYKGFLRAKEFVKSFGHLPTPLSLRSGQHPWLDQLGFGKDYKYSHESEKGWVHQVFLPKEIEKEKFYIPIDRGYEKQIKLFMQWLKSKGS